MPPFRPILLALAWAAVTHDAGTPSHRDPPITTVVRADSRFAAVRDSLIAKVRAGKIPSIAIAVTERGRTVWEEAIGWADREQRVPAKPEMPYALGSLSKSLAATVVLTLVDRGVLDLDAPIDRWVRLAAPTGVVRRPTLRQVLDASGGIPHGWRSGEGVAVPTTDSAWDRWMDQNVFVAFPPGVVFEYSNNSFGVAARVAERAAGVPFDTLARRALFEPLGMTASHTIYDARYADAIPVPYSGDGTALPRTASVPDAGLGMLASVEDLARFGNFIRGRVPAGERSPLSPAMRAEIWRPAVGPSRDFFHFGFWNGGRTLVTTGNIGGANAHLAIGRSTDVVVAVAVNQTGNDADEAAGAIERVLIPSSPGDRDVRADYDALYRRPYEGAPGLRGPWNGTMGRGADTVPVQLEAGADSVRIRLSAGAWLRLAGARMSGFGVLRGSVVTASPAFAGTTGPVQVALTLRWEGNRMRGYLLPRGAIAEPLPMLLTRGP